MSIIRLGVISLLFFHFANSQLDELLERDLPIEDQIEVSAVQKPKDHNHVVLSNGIVNMTFTVPEGFISGLSFKGSDNLLNTDNGEDDRGYWDMTWTNTADSSSTDKLYGTTYKILAQNEQQTEISFTRTWSRGSSEAPLSIDKRFVLLKDSPGFYTYTVIKHRKGWPASTIKQARVVLKYQEKFTYMAMSDARQRIMPTAKDRSSSRVLNFKEAVLLTNPTNPKFKGEVDDKYYYSSDNKDINVHGWVGDDFGAWMITPSNEFRAGGPFKTSLTSHTGPTMLNMFTSTHYAGEPLAIDIKSTEDWEMVWGPVFVYLNSDPSAKHNPSKLWEDAKLRARKERESWPYDFPLSNDFLKSNQRGTLMGQLLVQDWFKDNSPIPTALAHVGLARPGIVGSWQYENKGYQFWTRTDKNGNFVIRNVIPGTYSLYAYVPGIIGDYKHAFDIKIDAGSKVEAKDIVFKAPRNGPTLWEIGIPDRTAAEFFIPNPHPRFKVHKFPLPVEKFREYGLWTRYSDLYPKKDLVFTVGKSDYKKDWFFAQVDRNVGRQSQPTTWTIVFDLQNVEKHGNYTLQLALAGAHYSEVQVRFNDPRSRPYFSTGRIGTENMIARHGIHGLYRWYSIVVSGVHLINGMNTIFLRQSRVNGPFGGVMYDYIRFEEPVLKQNS